MLLLAGFVAVERHGRRPMLDIGLFGKRTFAGANIAALLVSLAMFGIFFFVSLYMQNILGYSPVHAGKIFLPMTVLTVVSAPLAGKATDLFGPRWPISIGMLLLADRADRCSRGSACTPASTTSCRRCSSAASAWASRWGR